MGRCVAVGVLGALVAMGQFSKKEPEAAGMSKERLARASQLLAAEVKSGRVSAASIIVVRNGSVVLHEGFGAKPDAVYLLASISKPVNAVGLMILVERGLVSLDDPASKYLPELKGGDRALIRVKDLLSHTSGLPDMLPQNTELRRAHAPLSEFVNGALTTDLLYKPRTDFRYQSMGTLLAGEIVQRVTGQKLREFQKREIFDVLGMKDSSLGLGGRKIADTVWCQTGTGPDVERFGPNTEYWRDMGHPWGGMHSTVTDLAILMQTFLNGGQFGGKRLLSPVTVARMISDQNTAIGKPWGLGWGLATSPVWVYCGDLVSPRTFGHSGATGTVAWADPETQLATVVLTTRPSSDDDGRLLRTVSNAVAAAVVK
ncbi:MAG: beta-lactamase family protein [Acidobacteria bacterium]|nr:beta-lactamase family protein [Acidobacteriota bacterium]